MAKDMVLKRVLFSKDGILGTLSSDDGAFQCSTLEHAYATNSHGFLPKVPTGLYTCVRGMHRLADMKPFETFEIMKVKGHTGILFHAGNFNNDSEGCVLLGDYSKGDGKRLMILNSRVTFEKFMKYQAGVKEFVLTVIDPKFQDPVFI